MAAAPPSAAQLSFLGPPAARIFLSIRRTTANPLLETLDSLVTSAGVAKGSGGDGAAPAAAPAQLDERAALGDLPEAVRFGELLVAGGRGVVLSAQPGVRLQSRAASQELEVYMVRWLGGFGIGRGLQMSARHPGSQHTRKWRAKGEAWA